jgi:hypothetical protein
MVAMTVAGRIWAVALIELQLGCASLVEFPDDPELVEQGPWRCLTDAVERPRPVASTAHVRLPICDALFGCSLPPSGLTARLCARLDPNCDNPIPSAISYDGGVFDFLVPTGNLGFDGYLAIVAPSAPCTDAEVFGQASPSLCALLPGCDPALPDARCAMPIYLPSLEFFNPPIVADAELAPLTLASIATSAAIGQASGAMYDPTTTGSLLVTALDCDGVPAEGVTFAMDDPQGAVSQLIYLENNFLNEARQETDVTGIAIFTGVPAGFVNLAAQNSAGVRIGSVGAHVAASSNSFTTLVP